jgi:hypothetical protein
MNRQTAAVDILFKRPLALVADQPERVHFEQDADSASALGESQFRKARCW